LARLDTEVGSDTVSLASQPGELDEGGDDVGDRAVLVMDDEDEEEAQLRYGVVNGCCQRVLSTGVVNGCADVVLITTADLKQRGWKTS
jgi:hypothetical protein